MYRLIYKSTSSRQRLTRRDVRDILHSSMELNRESGLNGALLATKTHFLQVLEGDFDSVNETFGRIAADERHHTVRIIHFGPAASSLFEGWAMRGFGIFDLNKELEDDLRRKYGEEEGGIRFPLEEWSALSLIFDVNMMSDDVVLG